VGVERVDESLSESADASGKSPKVGSIPAQFAADGEVEKMADSSQQQSGAWLDTARWVAGLDSKNAWMLVGLGMLVLGVYIPLGIITRGTLPYTAGVQSDARAWGLAIVFFLVGGACVTRSASEHKVQAADKANGMGLVDWTYPQQRFRLLAIGLPPVHGSDVWMDVCQSGMHSPQKVATLKDGWLTQFYLDLTGTRSIAEIRFYAATSQTAVDTLQAHLDACTEEGRSFVPMTIAEWPATGLEPLLVLQVDNVAT
jgi:hypothetical protein